MKHYYLIPALFFLSSSLFSQSSSPGLMWVTPIQSGSDSPEDIGMEVVDVAVTPGGAAYVAGYCTSPCAFAPGVAVIPEAGGQSFFIAKYDGYTGQFEWVKDLGTIGEHPAHIVAPSFGGVYLATSFSVSSLDLGNGVTVANTCTGALCNEALLAKFGLSGEALWAKTYKGSPGGSFQVSGVEQVASGKIMTLISYDSEALDLGPGFMISDQPPTGILLSVLGENNGATLEVQFPATSMNAPYSKSLAFNQLGQGVMTGVFYDQILFSNGTSLTATDDSGAHFATGLDASGKVQWARKISSTDYADILSAEMDNEGAAYLAIDASTDLKLDDNTLLTINTNYAGAVLKLQGASFSVPVFIPYDTDDYAVMDVVVHPWGFIYTVGYMSEPITYGNTQITPDGCVDAFLTETHSDGLPASARSVGGSGCEAFANDYYGSCVGVDAGGFLYAAGGFLFNFNEDGFSFNGRGGFVTKINTGFVSTGEPIFAALDIFPNPSTGTFTVRLPELPENPAQMIMTNMQGQEVYRQEITALDHQIHGTLPSGMYLVILQDGNRVYHGKVSVE